MDALRVAFSTTLLFLLTGCQIPYLIKSAYNQMSLLADREPIDRSLNRADLTEDEKRKIRLAQEAREFAESELKLKTTKNYTSFVKLDRSHVTYVVSAAQKWELKPFLWNYPMVGKMPYKGYFKEQDAKDEESDLAKQNLDTYMRGVSAYSTLGWFKDPLLSSMLRYKDHDLVNTIIHETVHATLFIKSSADFNERMAVFVGNKGTEQFYLKKEGLESKTLKLIQEENEDDKLFSVFITAELKALEDWYKSLPAEQRSEALRTQRFTEIKTNYEKNLKTKLHYGQSGFEKATLNNARLLVYKTYMQDLSDFERLYAKLGNDMQAFLDACKTLESSKEPEKDLKKLL